MKTVQFDASSSDSPQQQQQQRPKSSGGTSGADPSSRFARLSLSSNAPPHIVVRKSTSGGVQIELPPNPPPAASFTRFVTQEELLSQQSPSGYKCVHSRPM